MGIVATRRISQTFFLLVMLGFCSVTIPGPRWWHLPGWPVNWLLELDPLVGLATLLATGTLYAGLAWGALTLIMTLVLGRFFCAWICPLGTLQHVMGWLGARRRKAAARIKSNRYHPAQALKYWLLAGLLAAAAGEAATRLLALPEGGDPWLWGVLALLWAGLATLALRRQAPGLRRAWLITLIGVTIWMGVVYWAAPGITVAGSLQTGLLDPLPLVYRSINLVVLPLIQQFLPVPAAPPRFYAGIGIMAVGFAAILLASLKTPRLYCRYICPLGALFGVLGRFYLLRIGKSSAGCGDCRLCEADCQGACEPASAIRTPECILCFNCWSTCRHNRMGYASLPSGSGEKPLPDLTRRSVLISLAAGAGTISLERVQGSLAGNWNPRRIRPPGALVEHEFLQRCIKCGQCMRVCPTNVIHPASFSQGWEAYWTPVLNFRIGRSGCQPTCVACSQICPTAALRPLSLAERMGNAEFRQLGPLAIGTAFVERGRCLPWAMDRPCIVCQENCPVSPKAIFTRTIDQPLPGVGLLRVESRRELELTLSGGVLQPGALATGDFAGRRADSADAGQWTILANSADGVTLEMDSEAKPPEPGELLQIVIRLQQPYVDPARCIGCGICEHECPVRGRAAIRVSAEGETREPAHRMLA